MDLLHWKKKNSLDGLNFGLEFTETKVNELEEIVEAQKQTKILIKTQ